jgi:hypothetical protein
LSGFNNVAFDVERILIRANAGRRNNFEVIKEERRRERSRNLVGSLAIEETSRGGLTSDPIAASWKCDFVERSRRQVVIDVLCAFGSRDRAMPTVCDNILTGKQANGGQKQVATAVLNPGELTNSTVFYKIRA